jgi:Ni/Fe-hydrogenase subunit HybB-like protein
MNLVIVQVLLGMLIPLVILIIARYRHFNEDLRKMLYFISAILIQLGILSTRWNVVVGGQLFSKSFRGLMTYKMQVTGLEGLVTALVLLAAPYVILSILVRLLPMRRLSETAAATPA